MSLSYTERLRLGQALHGGNRVRRIRRNRRMLSLCAKVAVVGVVALVCTGIAMAAPVVGAGGGADAIATKPGDSLFRLAGCGGNCGRGGGPNGLGAPGNLGSRQPG